MIMHRLSPDQNTYLFVVFHASPPPARLPACLLGCLDAWMPMPFPTQTAPHLKLKALPPRTDARPGSTVNTNRGGETAETPGFAKDNAATPSAVTIGTTSSPAAVEKDGGTTGTPWAKNETARGGHGGERRRRRGEGGTVATAAVVARRLCFEEGRVVGPGGVNGAAGGGDVASTGPGKRNESVLDRRRQSEYVSLGERPGASGHPGEDAVDGVSSSGGSGSSGGDKGSRSDNNAVRASDENHNGRGRASSEGERGLLVRDQDEATGASTGGSAGGGPSPFAFDQSAPRDGSVLAGMERVRVGAGRGGVGGWKLMTHSPALHSGDATPNTSRVHGDSRWSGSLVSVQADDR